MDWVCVLCALHPGCNHKKRFKKIEVAGRLMNYMTREPAANTAVYLYCDHGWSASSYERNSIRLDTTVTDSQGYFRLNSKASRREDYYLSVVKHEQSYSDTFFYSNGEKFVDLGTIYKGPNTFYYTVTVNTSSQCIWMYFPEPQSSELVPRGS